jgi:hypothetical protein
MCVCVCVCINYYAQWSFVHNSILYMYELLYLNKKKFRASHGYATSAIKRLGHMANFYWATNLSVMTKVPYM